MPATSVYAIPFPCEGDGITPATFYSYAMGIESAVSTVTSAGTAITHTPYALLFANVLAPAGTGVDMTGALSLGSSSGLTIGATTVTVITPGPYLITLGMPDWGGAATFTSARVSIFVGATVAFSRKYNPDAGGSVAHTETSGLINLNVGDTVSFHFVWTGAGVPNGFSGLATMRMFATP